MAKRMDWEKAHKRDLLRDRGTEFALTSKESLVDRKGSPPVTSPHFLSSNSPIRLIRSYFGKSKNRTTVLLRYLLKKDEKETQNADDIGKVKHNQADFSKKKSRNSHLKISQDLLERESKQGFDRSYQRDACHALQHLGMHKDIRIVNNLLNGMPHNLRPRMRAFLSKYAPVSFDGNGKAYYDRTKKTSLGLALEKAWWLDKTPRNTNPVSKDDLKEEISCLKHRIKALEGQIASRDREIECLKKSR